MPIYTEELSLEDRRLFWRNYDKIVALFGAEKIDEGLMALKPSDIVEIYAAPLEGPTQPFGRNDYSGKCWLQPNRQVSPGREYVTFCNGEWEQHKRVLCNRYLVPHQYQSLRAESIIRPALVAKLPWLEGFKLAIYQMDFLDNFDDEFYVSLESKHGGHTSLYVPYKAALSGDVAAIVKRNESYLKWYCKTDDVWASMKADPVVVAFLDNVKGEANAKEANSEASCGV